MSANISNLVQQAALAYLKSVPTITTVSYNSIAGGIEEVKKPLPRVTVQCAAVEPEFYGCSNGKAMLNVMVRSNADPRPNTEDDVLKREHFARCDEIFGLFASRTLANDLSDALENFTAFVVKPGDSGWQTEDRSWVSWSQYEVIAAPADIVD